MTKDFKTFLTELGYDREEYPFHADRERKIEQSAPKITTQPGKSIEHGDHTITFHNAENHNLDKEGKPSFIGGVSPEAQSHMKPHLDGMKNQFGSTVMAKVKNNNTGNETYHHINISSGSSPTAVSPLGKHDSGQEHNKVLTNYLGKTNKL